MTRLANALTPTKIVQDTGTDIAQGTVMTVIAGLVADGTEIIAAEWGDDSKLLVHLKNTTGTDKIVTFVAGTGPRSGIGDLEVTVAATSGEKLVILESSRFKQADGALYINFAAGMTGFIGIYKLPQV